MKKPAAQTLSNIHYTIKRAETEPGFLPGGEYDAVLVLESTTPISFLRN